MTVKNNKNKKVVGKIVSSITLKDKKPIIKIENLHLGFVSPTSNKYKEVIRDISLNVYQGEVLCLLGESGSGKSVLTSSLLGILGKDAKIKSGSIKIHDIDVSKWTEDNWNKVNFRGPIISMVFQNPMKTLNPIRKVGDQLMETLIINDRVDSRDEAFQLAREYLEITKIKNIDYVMNLYPYELSGGMIQRIVIANILATNAQLVVLDEPTTALDPVVQAEIISLILELKDKFSTSFIFITHDIGVASVVADRIAIMYAGKIVEYGTTKDVIWHPQHPYTWDLILAMPDLNKGDTLFSIPGSVPSDSTNANYEVFSPRNLFALNVDLKSEAPLYQISDTHFVYSRLVDKDAPLFEVPKLIQERWNKFEKEMK